MWKYGYKYGKNQFFYEDKKENGIFHFTFIKGHCDGVNTEGLSIIPIRNKENTNIYIFFCKLLADPDKAMYCSTNTSVTD